MVEDIHHENENTEATDTSTLSDVEYQAYLDERKALVEARRETSLTLDKAILTLSGGAFGLSLTFIGNIAPNLTRANLTWLTVAWITFALSILITLISFYTSQRATTRQIEILELDYGLDVSTANKGKVNGWSRATFMLNMLAIGAFIVGAFSLATFTIENIEAYKTKGVAMSDKGSLRKATGGYVPPKPPKQRDGSSNKSISTTKSTSDSTGSSKGKK